MSASRVAEYVHQLVRPQFEIRKTPRNRPGVYLTTISSEPQGFGALPQGDSVIHNTQHVKKALSFPGAGAQSGRDVRVPLQA
jgi:hypothetical protein